MDVLFNKEIQVFRRDNNAEQRNTLIRLHVQFKASLQSALHVRITSPEDLFLLYTMTINQDDFQCLKQQQGLLVDFALFPKKFVDLLEVCLAEQNNSQPKFLLNFTCGVQQANLEVVETNSFKHLCHLALKFVPGSSEQVKSYLVDCLKQTKTEKVRLEEHLRSTEDGLRARLSTAQHQVEERTRELEACRMEMQHRLDETTTQLTKQVQDREQNMNKLQTSFEHRHNVELNETEEKFRKTIKDHENKLNEYENDNKNLSEQKYRYESLIRDLNAKITSYEEERKVTSRDLVKTRQQNTNMDLERLERDKTLNHLRTRVAVLEQELKDKKQVIKRTNDLLESAKEKQHQTEAQLGEKTNHVTQYEITIQSVSKEVLKGNEIIRKLQTELKASKQRIKVMSIVTTKQERLIEQKDGAHALKENQINELNNRLKEREEELCNVKQDFEESNQKLNESKEELKNNENVINWLNRQLNEQTVKLSSTSKDPTNLHTTNVRGTTNFQDQPDRQLAYRSVFKNQFHSNGISPIVRNTRHNSTPHDANRLDPKYLMRKKPEENAEQKENSPPSSKHPPGVPNPLVVGPAKQRPLFQTKQ